MKYLLALAVVFGLSIFTYSFSSIFNAQIALAGLAVFALSVFVRLWSIRKSKKSVNGYSKDKAELRKRFTESA